jgi:hypothetical protein
LVRVAVRDRLDFVGGAAIEPRRLRRRVGFNGDLFLAENKRPRAEPF